MTKYQFLPSIRLPKVFRICFLFSCWAANIQIRPNMSEVVEQMKEIQKFFPEASEPLVFSEGKSQTIRIINDKVIHIQKKKQDAHM